MLQIINGDALTELRKMPDEQFRCCVTSPPYFGLRDYGHADQIGHEATPDAYTAKLVEIFGEIKRVLTDDGTLWLNIGDCYAGSGKGGNPGDSPFIKQKSNAGSLTTRGRKQSTPQLDAKQLIGIPWRVAFALQCDGWFLRSDIIWAKPNCMPESVTDRPTRSHEYLFLLSKSSRYFYDADAIKEPAIYFGLTGQDDSGFKDATNFKGKHSALTGGAYHPPGQSAHGNARDHSNQMDKTEQCSGMRNKRDVWTVPVSSYADAHFATFPEALILPCILAGTANGDAVIDPFGGSGTTAKVAIENGRRAALIELNPEYVKMAHKRCHTTIGLAI